MKKYVFISQPMKGLTPEQILRNREVAIMEVMRKLKDEVDNVEIIDSYIHKEKKALNYPLYCLAESLKLLACADYAYFGEGWEGARGCKIEHTCAKEYGIEIIKD